MFSRSENNGKHIHEVVERTQCKKHKAAKGFPCWSVFVKDQYLNDRSAVCGERIREAGFVGKISPQSMRAKAPAKRADGTTKKPWAKKAPSATRSY